MVGGSNEKDRKCILGVFAHPDDETPSSGGSFTRYAREGVEIHVATATRGEQGTLGTEGLKIAREDLPKVREQELRSVLKLYGAHPPTMLGYRDQEVSKADFGELVGKVRSVMEKVRPDVVITFGPTGISGHEDHKAVHRAAMEGFRQYRPSATPEPRLLYFAIPEEVARRFDLDVEGPEVQPNVLIDVTEFLEVKLRALRLYRSQEDAQEIAELFEKQDWTDEGFHQVDPPLPDGVVHSGFWG